MGLEILRQGGHIRALPRGEGSHQGTLAGLAVGVVATFFLAGNVGVLGTCALVGLALGRTFDRPSVHRTT